MSKQKRIACILLGILLWGLLVGCYLLLRSPRLSRDKQTIRFSVRQKDVILNAIRDLSDHMTWGPGPNAPAFRGAPFDFISVSDGAGQNLYYNVRYYWLIGTVHVHADKTFRFSEEQVIMELARRIGITDKVEPLPLPETNTN